MKRLFDLETRCTIYAVGKWDIGLVSILTFLAGLMPFSASSQLSGQDQKILEGLTAYRSELLEKNSEDRVLLGGLIKALRENGMSKEEQQSLIYRLRNLAEGKSLPAFDNLAIIIEGTDPETTHSGNLPEVILRNEDLYHLMYEDIIHLTYPFSLNGNSFVFDELRFYNIQSGDHIAEIGAGTGEFAAVMGVIYDSLSLYVNEIVPEKVDYLITKLSQTNSIKPHVEFTYVLGTDDNPQLPDKYFDKVIIRRAFHHFSDKPAMLMHIRKCLKNSGELLLYETVRGNGYRPCSYAMRDKDIRRLVERNGFELAGTWRDGPDLCYKFLQNQ